eukprot:scaffold18716_cov128-Isochrysis_galbana.AAC.3
MSRASLMPKVSGGYRVGSLLAVHSLGGHLLEVAKDGLAHPLLAEHNHSEDGRCNEEDDSDDDDGNRPTGYGRWRTLVDGLVWSDRAQKLRRSVHQHFRSEERHARLKVHVYASSHEMKCRGHQVQSGRTIARTKCGSAEGNSDIVRTPHEAGRAERTVVVYEVNLSDRSVPRSIHNNHDVGMRRQNGRYVDACPASIELREHVGHAGLLHDQVGCTGPGSDKHLPIVAAVNAVKPESSKTSTRKRGHGCLSYVEVVPDLGDKLVGNRLHVEYLTKLTDDRVHGLLCGTTLRPERAVLARHRLQPRAYPGRMEIRAACTVRGGGIGACLEPVRSGALAWTDTGLIGEDASACG